MTEEKNIKYINLPFKYLVDKQSKTKGEELAEQISKLQQFWQAEGYKVKITYNLNEYNAVIPPEQLARIRDKINQGRKRKNLPLITTEVTLC